MGSKREGFTLIEVMVAVMIVSVVIGALWQMRGDATHKFLQFQKMATDNQYITFLLGNSAKYGFETSHTDMKTLVDDFELESDLRRTLKNKKVTISYETRNSIDTNDSVVLEIGLTQLKWDDVAYSLVRVRMP
jgi:prepilin-type N-terminal cleavage/methylation domain-containing protein